MSKVLIFDIETAPILAYVWKKWHDGPVLAIEDDWYMLCWAAKWVGSRKIMTDAIWKHKEYSMDAENDGPIVRSLWRLLDEADVVVTHNGDRFDIRKLNARCIINHVDPPSPYHSIDTLKLARKKFHFTSNRLDDLGDYLGVGRKVETGGFSLWQDTLAGVVKAHKKMVKYNRQDVILLEAVYGKLLKWCNIPNLYTNADVPTCTRCGSTHVQRRGYYVSRAGLAKYQRYQCQSCGGWSRSRKNLLTLGEKENILVPL